MVVTNSDRLVLTRVSGPVMQAAANQIVAPDGSWQVRPGQGGVVLGVELGSRAGGWESDHLEVGASIRHPEPAADRALQVLACVGNVATTTTGPASGSTGTVVGKHGAVLVAFPPAALERLGPGDWVTVDAVGLGLRIGGEPEVAVHSCAPSLLERLVRSDGGRLAVEVVAALPAEAGAAGIGMPVDHLNLDLEVGAAPLDGLARDLRFGDVVALQDHDHRYGRQVRAGWIAIGVIAHGRSVSGGHGFGFVTLLSGPAERFTLRSSPHANLVELLSPQASQ
jgi:uncharacterized protein DUF4438